MLEMKEETMRRVMREMGKRGGLKGGPARSKKLTPEQRSEIARKAVEERWRRYRAAKAAKGMAPKRKGA